MGKLGKKARKFAKKNLQSVHKRRRKMKSTFKRKAPSRHKDALHDTGDLIREQLNKGSSEGTRIDDNAAGKFLDDIFAEGDDNYLEDISESDGFLSEDSECPYIFEDENEGGDEDNHAVLLGENEKIHMEIVAQKKRLDCLLEKDPKFSEFLASRRAELEASKHEDIYSDEEDGTKFPNKDDVSEHQSDKKTLTTCTIDVWCWLVMEEPNGPALSNLLNGFRTACQYGIDSDECPLRISNKEVFSKILTFVLNESDGIFRRLLGISDFCNHERIQKLKNTSMWETAGPLLKSYLRSCLLLLNQVTDGQILVLVLTRLKASTVFFAAFPSLTGRLIKILVHLLGTGEESLSLSSFLMIRDISLQLGSDCLDKCLSQTYKAFVAHCKFAQTTNLKHLEFLTNSIVELYSLDIQKSYPKVLLSLQHLANILRQTLKSKKKEELKKICNWQFLNCANLWVKFITLNIKDHDLQPLSALLIEIINGMAYLFPGPRHLPLRLKCVHMLNNLSSASGLFIPIASLVFDCLEYKGGGNGDTARGKPLDLLSVLKVPKQFLKSRGFQEECIHSAIELLLAHFSHWSYHISFPEVATIPLILMKRFHEKTTLESLRRSVKRFIDQVEQNIELIRRKRDEVGFSPKDHESVQSFLQLEKNVANASFTQYYASILQKSRFNQSITV
ncbi:nucleolar complex protein 2 homolog [Asparagus officinalis]|uniref:nucleolar complex protein 2 homolog n=1 Tax=Asparagus officinalis TaxID=4686 RepID=UPI00098E6036|nr:nucleolar complex protein 2 homolog [Asparagus officinalis]XP_020276601.1 nucleolar complex protein 2 homolog [Asparagus officinalis]